MTLGWKMVETRDVRRGRIEAQCVLMISTEMQTNEIRQTSKGSCRPMVMRGRLND